MQEQIELNWVSVASAIVSFVLTKYQSSFQKYKTYLVLHKGERIKY